MSDFLTSLAQRSSSSTNDVLPTPKSRYQTDANDARSFVVDRDVDSGNGRYSLDAIRDRGTPSAGERPSRPSSSAVEAAVGPSENKQAIGREFHQPVDLRRENKKELPSPPVPTSIREVVRETRREIEVTTEVVLKGESEVVPKNDTESVREGGTSVARNGETESNPARSTPSSFIRPETTIDPVVRHEVVRPTLTSTVPNKPVSTSAQEPSEIKSPPQAASRAASEVPQVTQVIEKIREPVVERITEILPAVQLQPLPSVSVPRRTFESSPQTASSATETIVNVTIGKIEIRAQVEGKRTQRATVKESSNADSLREYLSRRST